MCHQSEPTDGRDALIQIIVIVDENMKQFHPDLTADTSSACQTAYASIVSESRSVSIDTSVTVVSLYLPLLLK